MSAERLAPKRPLLRPVSSLAAALESSLHFGEPATRADAGIQRVMLTDLRAMPNQVRRAFDQTGLQELAADIAQNGVIQPLLVRPLADGLYEVVAGERRMRAAKLAGLEAVPVLVRELSDLQARKINLFENLNRSDLNDFEAAHGVFRVLGLELGLGDAALEALIRRASAVAGGQAGESGLSASERPQVAAVMTFFKGVERMTVTSYVNNLMPLRHAPSDLAALLERGQIEYTKAIVLMRVTDPDRRAELTQRCLAGLSLADLKLLATRSPAAPLSLQTPPSVQRQLDSFSTRSSLKLLPSGRSKLTLEFRDRASLERVLERFEISGQALPPAPTKGKPKRSAKPKRGV